MIPLAIMSAGVICLCASMAVQVHRGVDRVSDLCMMGGGAAVAAGALGAFFWMIYGG